ncbi:MAG: DUF47 family protein [Nitrospirota bacterium]
MGIFPKKRDFFKMLLDQSNKTQAGLEALKKYVEDNTPENGEGVRVIEQEADTLRRILIEELNQTFVTPIDREDIFALSRAIDDLVDYANTTVNEMEIYGVNPDDHIREMVGILRDAGRELNSAIQHLQKYPAIALEKATKAKALENTMESAYHSSLADLFKGNDVVYMLKMREIYRHLSNAADRGDEAADIIGDIVVKSIVP